MPAIDFPSSDGTRLSGVIHAPAGARGGVVVCHPHPHFGGSMTTNLIRRIAEASADAGWTALRFDFRGVGASAGESTADLTEVGDVLGALAELDRVLGPDAPRALVGYSFGAWVAAHASTSRDDLRRLVLIAPPILARELPATSTPTTAICGDADAYCAVEALGSWCASIGGQCEILAGADHFLGGREAEVVRTVVGALG